MAITEAEIREETLRQLASSPGGKLTTTKLIEILEGEMKPIGHDAEILDGRSDTYFSQKVRNLVSHRNQSTGMATKGYAINDPDSEAWTITDHGRRHVDSAVF